MRCQGCFLDFTGRFSGQQRRSHQTTSPMAQIPNLFRSLNIEIWDLFGIRVLLFEIFYH
jgi:hypothetical protein